MIVDSIAPCAAPARTALRTNSPGLGFRGFTLIELIVVMAVLGVLALMAIPSYEKIKDRAREVRAMEEIRGLEKSINAYSIDNGGNLPDNLQQIGRGGVLDPWGKPYVYYKIVSDDDPAARFYVRQLNKDFDLYSLGYDDQTDLDIDLEQSLNDVLRIGEGGFVGRASDYIRVTP